jgi:hypothetical protein
MELAPPWDLIKQYKRDQDGVLYTNHYKHLVLSNLNPETVYRQLGEDAVLLCWEGRGKFCHRRVVAEWLEKFLNIEIPEL